MKRTIISMALAVASWTAFSASAATVRLNSPADCQLFGISDNGEWAVGMQGSSASEYYAFRWNLITNEVEISSEVSDCGNSISDDGVYCGGFDYTDPATGRKFKAPGYYDGSWHVLPMPAGTVADAFDGAISPDGRHMAISLVVNGQYVAAQYKDNQLVRIMKADTGHSDDYSRAICISDDGRYVGGWTNAHIPGISANRTAVIWEGDSDYKIIDPNPADPERGPFSQVYQFTSDNKNLLLWGGWVNTSTKPDGTVDPAHIIAIYNLEDQTFHPVYPVDQNASAGISVCDMADDLTVVGNYAGNATITVDGKMQYLVDWLKETKGIDARAEWTEVQTYEGAFLIETARTIQRNGQSIGVMYIGTDGEYHAMIIKFDVDVTDAPPVKVDLSAVTKANAIRLDWKLPYGVDLSTVKGCNIYRNGVKINDAPVTGDHYYDSGLTFGTEYTYEMTTVYNSGESPKSTAVKYLLEAPAPEAPVALTGRQRGLNSAIVAWEKPYTNLIQKQYYDRESATDGFGVNEVGLEAEAGVKFDAEEMAIYGNAKISAVEFVPMSKQRNWRVHLYSEDVYGIVTELASYKVTQELALGERNMFELPTPIALPAGKNLIASVSYEASDEATMANAFGIQFGNGKPGYSDLLRRILIPEEDFASLYEMAQAGGMNFSLCWKVGVVLTPEGASADADRIDKYIITRNGEEIGRCDTTDYTDANLADGTYNYGVSALYADGSRSEATNTDVTIQARLSAYAPVDDLTVNVGESSLDANWSAPVDKDITTITWSKGPNAKAVTAGNNNYALRAAAIYPASFFNGFGTYQIIGACFYPTCDATYDIIVDNGRGSEELVVYEVDSYNADEWNTVYFDEPLTISPNASYRMIVDCYDVETHGAPMGLDTYDGLDGYSALINVSSTTPESWQEVSGTVNMPCSWMMGLIIADQNGMPLPVKGYDVLLDNRKLNSSLLTSPEYSSPIDGLGVTGNAQHELRVDTWYEPLTVAVPGQPVTVTINAGVDETFVADIAIHQDGTRIKVTTATSVAIYDVNGRMVASADGDTVSVDNLGAGVYILKAATPTKPVVTKLNLHK